MTKEPLGLSGENWHACLRNTHIYVFHECFSFRHILTSSCCFYTLSSLTKTKSPRLLIMGYSNSVISYNDISINPFLCSHCSVFVLFSSLNMWLEVLHLEYHFIACFFRLTNCLKMSVTSTSMMSFWWPFLLNLNVSYTFLCCWLWAVKCLVGIYLFLISFVDDFSKLVTMFSINNWVTSIKIFTHCVSVHKQTWLCQRRI